jgi:hypothetical protein
MIGSSITFDDPIINRSIVELGGWAWLCEQTDAQWPFIGNRFEQIYRQLRTTGCAEYPTHLVGLTEATNRSLEAQYPNPVLVGNKVKALNVLQSGDPSFLQIHVASNESKPSEHATSKSAVTRQMVSSQGLTLQSIM